MIHIISTFYVSKYGSNLDNERTDELCNALLHNINSEYVEKIHLFLDDEDAVEKLRSITNSEKIEIISVGKKPKYCDFFEYIIHHVQNKICMIINADIYLAECDQELIQRLLDTKIGYTLTRYEWDMSHYLIDNYCGSHDCYIFNSKFLTENIVHSPHTLYNQNIPGIESQIISALLDEGLTMYNPCKQIKIVHLHKSELRNRTGEWIGLHRPGNDELYTSRWYISPVYL